MKERINPPRLTCCSSTPQLRWDPPRQTPSATPQEGMWHTLRRAHPLLRGAQRAGWILLLFLSTNLFAAEPIMLDGGLLRATHDPLKQRVLLWNADVNFVKEYIVSPEFVLTSDWIASAGYKRIPQYFPTFLNQQSPLGRFQIQLVPAKETKQVGSAGLKSSQPGIPEFRVLGSYTQKTGTINNVIAWDAPSTNALARHEVLSLVTANEWMIDQTLAPTANKAMVTTTTTGGKFVVRKMGTRNGFMDSDGESSLGAVGDPIAVKTFIVDLIPPVYLVSPSVTVTKDILDRDAMSIEFEIDEPGYLVFQAWDSNGNLRYEATQNVNATTLSQFVWSGDDQSGLVRDGNYRYRFTTKDLYENKNPAITGNGLFDTQPPMITTTENLSMRYLSPNGDGIQDILSYSVAFNKVCTLDAQLLSSDEGVVWQKIIPSVSGNQVQVGPQLSGKPDGMYRLILTITDTKGRTDSVTANFQVDTALPVAQFPERTVFSKTGSRQLLKYQLSEVATLKIKVASDNITHVGAEGENYMIFDGSRLSEGRYNLVVPVMDLAGNMATYSMQVVVDKTGPTLNTMTELSQLFLNQDTLFSYAATDNTSSKIGLTLELKGANNQSYAIFKNTPMGTTLNITPILKQLLPAASATYSAAFTLTDEYGNQTKWSQPVVIDKGNIDLAISSTWFLPSKPTVGTPVTLYFISQVEGKLSATVLDSNGRLIQTLSDKQSVVPGRMTLPWNGKDTQGISVKPGTYSVRLAMQTNAGVPYRAVVANMEVMSPQDGAVADNGGSAISTDASYYIFSPDGDAIQDTLQAQVKLQSRDLKTVVAQIQTRSGRLVKELVRQDNPSSFELSWNGQDFRGNMQPDQQYILSIQATDQSGEVLTKTVPIYLLREKIKLVYRDNGRHFSFNGDKIRDTLNYGFSFIYPALLLDNAGYIRNTSLTIGIYQDNRLVSEKVVQATDRYQDSFSGAGLHEGPFQIRIKGEGANRVLAEPITLDYINDLSGTALRSSVASSVEDNNARYYLFTPNADGLSDTLETYYQLAGVGTRNILAEIHTSGGSLVRTLYQNPDFNGDTISLNWDGKNESDELQPDGQYQLHVTALNSAGITTTDQTPVYLVTDRISAKYQDNGTYFSFNNDGAQDTLSYSVDLTYPALLVQNPGYTKETDVTIQVLQNDQVVHSDTVKVGTHYENIYSGANLAEGDFTVKVIGIGSQSVPVFAATDDNHNDITKPQISQFAPIGYQSFVSGNYCFNAQPDVTDWTLQIAAPEPYLYPPVYLINGNVDGAIHEGLNAVYVTYTDYSGNVSTPSNILSFIVDTVPPEITTVNNVAESTWIPQGTSHQLSTTINDANFQKLLVDITDPSGLTYRYNPPNEAMSFGIQNAIGTGISGIYSVSLTACDYANYLSSPWQTQFRYDKTSPQITQIGTDRLYLGESTQYLTPQLVGVTEAHSGIHHYDFSIDGSAWAAFSPGASLDLQSVLLGKPDGVKLFKVRTQDVAGNYSSEVGTNVFVDRVKPNFQSSIADTIMNIKITPIAASFTYGPVGTDSGFLSHQYQIRKPAAGSASSFTDYGFNNLDIDYGIPFIQAQPNDADGNYILDAWTSDRAGNKSVPISIGFIVDTVKPSVGLSLVKNYLNINTTPLVFSTTYSDTTNGTFQWQIFQKNGPLRASGACVAGTTTLTAGQANLVAGDGVVHELIITATDEAGNSTSQSIDFYNDTQAPTVTVQSLSATVVPPLSGPGTNDGDIILQYSLAEGSADNIFNHKVRIISTLPDSYGIRDVMTAPGSGPGGANGEISHPNYKIRWNGWAHDNGVNYRQLPDGIYGIEIVAEDKAGNLDHWFGTIRLQDDHNLGIGAVVNPSYKRFATNYNASGIPTDVWSQSVDAPPQQVTLQSYTAAGTWYPHRPSLENDSGVVTVKTGFGDRFIDWRYCNAYAHGNIDNRSLKFVVDLAQTSRGWCQPQGAGAYHFARLISYGSHDFTGVPDYIYRNTVGDEQPLTSFATLLKKTVASTDFRNPTSWDAFNVSSGYFQLWATRHNGGGSNPGAVEQIQEIQLYQAGYKKYALVDAIASQQTPRSEETDLCGVLTLGNNLGTPPVYDNGIYKSNNYVLSDRRSGPIGSYYWDPATKHYIYNHNNFNYTVINGPGTAGAILNYSQLGEDIVWEDTRSGQSEIYYQKINSNIFQPGHTPQLEIQKLKTNTLQDSFVLVSPKTTGVNEIEINTSRPEFNWKVPTSAMTTSTKFKIQLYKAPGAADEAMVTFNFVENSLDDRYQVIEIAAGAARVSADRVTFTPDVYNSLGATKTGEVYRWQVAADWNGDGTVDLTSKTSETFKVNPVLAIEAPINYPNPFTTSTKIRYKLTRDAKTVYIKIFDVIGRPVRTITGAPTDGTRPFHEYHDVEWDGKNGVGDDVNNGVYIYKIIATDATDGHKVDAVGRMVRLR